MGVFGLSLPKKAKSIISAVERQINPLDNGRTAKQVTPTNNRSTIGQITHSGPMNLIGDLAVKPFVINPFQIASETGRMIGAEFTHNIGAQKASQARQATNLRSSLPGVIGKVGWDTGDVIRRTPQQIVTDIHGFQGHAPTPNERANQNAGLHSFQSSLPGIASPLTERAITNIIPSSKQNAVAAGYNPDEGLFKQAVIDPVSAALLGKGATTVTGNAGRATAEAAIRRATPGTMSNFFAQKLTQLSDEKAALDAQTQAGMGRVRVAQNEALFNKSIQPNGQKLLAAPEQNFVIAKQENARIAKATEVLAKSYETDYNKLAKAWKNSPKRMRVETAKLDAKYQAEHDNLLNATGKFAEQRDKTKPTVRVKGNVKVTQPKTAEKKIKVSVNPIKIPEVNEMPMKNTNALDRRRQISGELEKMGGAATDIADALHYKRETGEKGAAAARTASPTVMGFKRRGGGRDLMEQAVNHLQGKQISTNPTVIKAANEMKAQFDKVHELANKAGIPVPKRENYFPHFSDIPKEGTSAYSKAVDHLLKTKQYKTPAEAVKALEYSRKLGLRNKFASFEKQRTADLPDYPKTKAVYKQYLEQAYDQIAHAKHFGPQDEILNHFIDKINEQGGSDAAKKALDLFNEADKRKSHSETASKISNTITGFEGATKLGTSSIGNLAQQVNNAVVGGTGKTIENMAKSFSNKEKDFLNKTGVGDEGVTRESIESRTGISSDRVRALTAPFFGPVERMNRKVGALNGRDRAMELTDRLNKARADGNVKKAAKYEAQLRDRKTGFDVQGEIGKTLTEDQQISAARSFVHRTQFRTEAQDLPRGSTGNVGRVVTQFRRYPYKQTQFLKREVIDPALKGDLRPAIRVGTLGPTVGAGTSTVRDKLNNRDSSDDSTVDKALNIASAGGFSGLETSLGKNLMPKGSDNADKYTIRVIKALGGPAITDVTNAIGSVGDAKKAERLAASHIPVAGQAISNTLLPFKTKEDKASETKKQSVKDGKKELEKTVGEKDSLQQFDDGNYYYTIKGDKTVHSTSDLESAREAMRKASFKASDAQKKTIGDTVYLKKKDGEVFTKTKIQYNYEQDDAKNKLGLDRAVASGDLKGWFGIAQKQIDNLESRKGLYNPETEQDEIDKITLQQENLMEKAAKYQEYGGFTKGRSGNKTISVSGHIAHPNSIPTTARPVAVRTVAVRARARPSKPRVTVRKSRV